MMTFWVKVKSIILGILKTTFAPFWATFGKNLASLYFNIWLHCQ